MKPEAAKHVVVDHPGLYTTFKVVALNNGTDTEIASVSEKRVGIRIFLPMTTATAAASAVIAPNVIAGAGQGIGLSANGSDDTEFRLESDGDIVQKDWHCFCATAAAFIGVMEIFKA